MYRAGSGANAAGSTPARGVVVGFTLAIGLIATAVGVITVAAVLYFTLISLRSDRHSPATIRDRAP
mgnify:CR=1 FL=1